MIKYLAIALVFLVGCGSGGGDRTTTVSFTSSCVFGNVEQGCIAFDEFTPEGESNDLECHEQQNGLTSVCGPQITLDAAIANGSPSLSDFLAKGVRVETVSSDFDERPEL